MKHIIKIKSKKKLLFTGLAFIMLLAGNGMTLCAETTSQNQVMAQGEEASALENDVQDYIYFGSYPQTEITDEAVITAIENVIKEEDRQLASDNQPTSKYHTENPGTGSCVWVDGIKYSRIGIDNVNSTNHFGTDKQYRYYKWERIRWKVLKNDGKTLLVMADTVLDCKRYHETKRDVTWEQSTLRSWLNGYDSEKNIENMDYSTDSFFGNAFSKGEQAAVVLVKKDNAENVRYHTAGGNATTDPVFLLSIEEVKNEEYGFSANAYISESRQVKASDFAYTNGAARSTMTGREENCDWWLRSLGMYGYDAAYVNFSGYVNEVGLIVPYEDMGIRPALYIDLDSESWITMDDGTSGEGGEQGLLTGLYASKVKTAYMQGENLNVDDLTVTAVYSHNAGELQRKLLAGAYMTNASDLDMNTPGNKTLTVSCTEGDRTKTADITISVNQKAAEEPKNQPVMVEKLTIKAPSKKLAAGKKVKLAVTVSPANATNQAVTWKTSNKKYATVNKKGNITLKKAGIGKTVTITATAKDGSGKKASLKIKIMQHAVKSIKLTAFQKTLKAGKSMTVKAAVKTTGGKVNKVLKWSSSNPKYAAVSQKGKVTAKKAGKGKTVTITAQSTDGSNKKAKIKVKIK